MSEALLPTEKVRNLTTAPRRLPIEVEGHVTHEIILTIWTTMSPKDTNSGHELGQVWVDRVREMTGEELQTELQALGGPWFYAWLSISSLLLSAPHPHHPDHALDWLESIDDQRLRRWVIGHLSHRQDQSALIEQAASGDLDAMARLVEGPYENDAKKQAADEAIEFTKEILLTNGIAKRYAAALKRFRTDVFTEWEDDFAGSIGRAAAARRSAPTRGSAKEVIEEVTSGIDFEIPLGIGRVVLVPSVVTRPLSLIDEARGTLVVYYGVADEFIDSDPEAPPSWLVRMFKALSDEKRLRILRRLSEGETTLDELTEMLGLSKSTVHHHISQLRAAGLVRIQIPSSDDSDRKHTKTYNLREQSLADANQFLDIYLRTADTEEDNA